MATFGKKISLFLGFWPLCLEWPLLGLAGKVLLLPNKRSRPESCRSFAKACFTCGYLESTFGPLPHLSLRMRVVALCPQVACRRSFQALPCNCELHPVWILLPCSRMAFDAKILQKEGHFWVSFAEKTRVSRPRFCKKNAPFSGLKANFQPTIALSWAMWWFQSPYFCSALPF